MSTPSEPQTPQEPDDNSFLLGIAIPVVGVAVVILACLISVLVTHCTK